MHKTGCFTGHRIIPKDQIPIVHARLIKEVETLINQGAVCFLAGGARGFDTLAAQTVLVLKEATDHLYCGGDELSLIL